MRRRTGILAGIALIALTLSAEAGVVTLKNGTTFQGTPTGEVILVSTGRDLLELLPETIVSLRADEIRLADGRVITGTVVGGRLRFKTDLGEVAVALKDLGEYRQLSSGAPPAPRSPEPRSAAPPSAKPASPAAVVTPVSPTTTSRSPESQPGAKLTPRAGTATPLPPQAAGSGAALLPTPPAAQPVPPSVATSPPQPPASPQPSVKPFSPPVAVSPAPETSLPAPPGGPVFRVIASETWLYHEATVQADRVGLVKKGELVTYVDMIDRRLSLMGYLLDFGRWIKVKTAGGLTGWVEADALEAVREGNSARWIAP